jgi:hypothetical protein
VFRQGTCFHVFLFEAVQGKRLDIPATLAVSLISLFAENSVRALILT